LKFPKAKEAHVICITESGIGIFRGFKWQLSLQTSQPLNRSQRAKQRGFLSFGMKRAQNINSYAFAGNTRQRKTLYYCYTFSKFGFTTSREGFCSTELVSYFSHTVVLVLPFVIYL
jgi:hypothetical protein